jgi:5-deoxy-glucuronate isomerase
MLMPQLKFMYQPTQGLQTVVSSENSILQWISLRVLQLAAGETYTGNSGDEEQALVLMSGTCAVTCGDQRWEQVGGRMHVFAGGSYTVYAPPRTAYTVTAGNAPVEIAIGGAKATREGTPTLITPAMLKQEKRGVWNWERNICDVITTVNPISERLFIIEVYTPPGNWSSVPPHKHDRDAIPYESNAEEIYFFKMKPEQGFGFQRIYTEDGSIDEAVVAQHNCATIQPRGYHPVANHPGYQMYYLNIIAGEKRALIPHDDSQHVWVKDVEAVIKTRNS